MNLRIPAGFECELPPGVADRGFHRLAETAVLQRAASPDRAIHARLAGAFADRPDRRAHRGLISQSSTTMSEGNPRGSKSAVSLASQPTRSNSSSMVRDEWCWASPTVSNK